MAKVPRNGYITYSMPCGVNLGPGPNKLSYLEMRIEAEKKAGGPNGNPKRPHRDVTDDKSIGRDGPDVFYDPVDLCLYKQKDYSFKLPPRVKVDMAWKRPALNEKQPAYVERLYKCKPREDPWWYKRPPGQRELPIQIRRSQSAPTLPKIARPKSAKT